ncbi:alpha beta-propellor repeat-containing integrin [Streptomyces malaysiensis]|uniref:Alpha beta-propellor repeat-containing integrin n=1 Tax=Streptomyces malaysiensis TaxID=92644 RepID=A0A7X5WW72_STRMQ|nr:alpha beta-propellor repeat-containing integrin [Streptomyces malaysiensis]
MCPLPRSGRTRRCAHTGCEPAAERAQTYRQRPPAGGAARQDRTRRRCAGRPSSRTTSRPDGTPHRLPLNDRLTGRRDPPAASEPPPGPQRSGTTPPARCPVPPVTPPWRPPDSSTPTGSNAPAPTAELSAPPSTPPPCPCEQPPTASTAAQRKEKAGAPSGRLSSDSRSHSVRLEGPSQGSSERLLRTAFPEESAETLRM